MDCKTAQLIFEELQRHAGGEIIIPTFEGGLPSWKGMISGRAIVAGFTPGNFFRTLKVAGDTDEEKPVAFLEISPFKSNLTLLMAEKRQDAFARYMKEIGFMTEVEVGIEWIDAGYLIQTGDEKKVKCFFEEKKAEACLKDIEPFTVLDVASGRLKKYFLLESEGAGTGELFFERVKKTERLVALLERVL